MKGRCGESIKSPRFQEFAQGHIPLAAMVDTARSLVYSTISKAYESAQKFPSAFERSLR